MLKLPKIFITPWITLNEEEIEKCFLAGAYSARIHSGRLSSTKINELIKYYHAYKHKFYLDLTCNKARVIAIKHFHEGEFLIDQKVIFIKKEHEIDDIVCDHLITCNFFPDILKKIQKGDLNVDDGNLSFEIEKILKNNIGEVEKIICKVVDNNQEYVYEGDGISSKSIIIHSEQENLLTESDITILTTIPLRLRTYVKYIVISFCEKEKQIFSAINDIEKLDYMNFIIVPKIETVEGVRNIEEICITLKSLYGENAELQIGRGDLSQDAVRGKNKYNYNILVDDVIKVAKKYNVKVSVLAKTLLSSFSKYRKNKDTVDLEPSDEDKENIKNLCRQEVYQIGLTNDMYISRPERMVKILKKYMK